MTIAPHEYWQQLHPPGTLPDDPATGYGRSYPARLPDGRQIAFPIRVLPGGQDRAVASLILNQASFAVQDALAAAAAAEAGRHAPERIVGVPTLGLPLAADVARRLGHERMVALGTSRKFWYDEALSEPVASITSPGAGKRLYLDPRMLPVLKGRRIVVVDDVASTGATLLAVLRLLARAELRPVAAVFAMAQGDAGAARLAGTPWEGIPRGAALSTPRLCRSVNDRWFPDPRSED